eukprot:gene16431-18067_t
MVFSNGKVLKVRLHEQRLYQLLYCSKEICHIAKKPSCALLDILLAKGGPEAIAESFYSSMRAQQHSGSQSNETLGRRTKLHWSLPTLKNCKDVIKDGIKTYLEGDEKLRPHRQNTYFSSRCKDYVVSKVIDWVDSDKGCCPFLADKKKQKETSVTITAEFASSSRNCTLPYAFVPVGTDALVNAWKEEFIELENHKNPAAWRRILADVKKKGPGDKTLNKETNIVPPHETDNAAGLNEEVTTQDQVYTGMGKEGTEKAPTETEKAQPKRTKKKKYIKSAAVNQLVQCLAEAQKMQEGIMGHFFQGMR